jgi:NAD(P)-dependent dehydrogenase (short-subunit alcohol dehydrogenase family)
MKMNDISFNFSSKKVLVVGGSKGIGEEICKQFINSGADVYCASRTPCLVKNVINYVCDVEKEIDIENLFKEITDVDFCINAVGTNFCETIENISEAEWDRVLDINLKSIYLVSKKVVKLMKEKGSGRIVNISSIAGKNKSLVSGVHYTASKYGVIGLTKQLSKEVAKYDILVNCICPSQTKTEMLDASMSTDQLFELEKGIPLGRIANTREQAIPVLFLCSEGASYITGAAMDINGGQL